MKYDAATNAIPFVFPSIGADSEGRKLLPSDPGHPGGEFLL
jgi:hypothetical protein